MIVAVMQGRLLSPTGGRYQYFPADGWEREFPLAAEAGLDAIEWIWDAAGERVNPLATDEGVAAIRELSCRHGVAVRSLCADWFMDRPFVRCRATERAERVDALRWVIGRCAGLGIRRVVVPFVDASRIDGDSDLADAARSIAEALPAAAAAGIELHLETSLDPTTFPALLERLPGPWVRVNYDIGNSASLGYDPRREFEAYGTRVGSVHVKDRIRGGRTVPLGTGNADFPAVAEGLRRAAFRGEYVLQVARGTPGDEVANARRDRAFVGRTLP